MHTIRLRGPWQIAALISENPTTGEIEIPGDWGTVFGSEFAGPARFTRRFGLPTNLTNERVTLVIEQIRGAGSIALNGVPLGEQSEGNGARRYEITALLKLRNVLEIALQASGQPAGGIGEVRLEIEGS